MIILFVIFALVPLGLSNTVGYLQTRQDLTAQSFQNLENVAARQAVELENVLQSFRQGMLQIVNEEARLAAILRALHSAPPERLPELAHALRMQLATSDLARRGELLVLTATGHVLSSSASARPIGEDLSASACVRVQNGAGVTFETGPVPTFVSAIRVFDGVAGHVLGLFCGRFPLHQQALLHGSSDGALVHLLGEDGRVIASSAGGGATLVRHGSFFSTTPWQARDRLSDGTEVIAAYAPIAQLRLGVLALTPVARVTAFLDRTRARALLLTGILALALVGAVYLTVRSLTRPLKDIVEAAQQTADGARGASVSARGPTELVTLARAFNRMSLALKDSHENLEQRIAARTVELERSRAFVELLLDSIDQMVVVVDPSGRVIKMNQPAEKLLGAEALGKIGDDALIQRTLATRQRGREERSLRVGGQQEIVVMETAPMFAGDGTVEAVVQIGRMVTSERRIQAQMVHQEKMATVGLLAAGVAHEIGNPLASISSQLRLTRNADEPSRVSATLAIVEREVHRIAGLLRDLVGFARRRRDDLVLVSPNQVLTDAAQLVSHDPRRRNVTTELRLGDPVAPIRAKSDELLQVVLNLSLNALDSMPEGGSLVLESADEGEGSVIRVRDTGTGVPEDARPRLFEPFFTTKPPGRGTGLGLFVSKGIVENLGGQLVLESTSPSGSVFAVRLPADRGGAAARESEKQSA